MTDIVERLRTENCMFGYYESPEIQTEAADEIERLREALRIMPKTITEAADEIKRLRQQNAELVEALRPFAELADSYDPPEDDDDEVAWDQQTTPTLGQLRTARAAIAKAKGGE